jgi:hypothetical protein
MSPCVYSPMCNPLSLTCNGPVNKFPRQRRLATIELMKASFYMRSASYQRRVGVSVCVSPILVYILPNRRSEDFQSRQRVKYGHEFRGTRNEDSLCWRGPSANYWIGQDWNVYPSSLLGNGSVNTFPRQGINVGGVVFYAVCVVSMKSRQLVLTRTPCYVICSPSFSISSTKMHGAATTPLSVPMSYSNDKFDIICCIPDTYTSCWVEVIDLNCTKKFITFDIYVVLQ